MCMCRVGLPRARLLPAYVECQADVALLWHPAQMWALHMQRRVLSVLTDKHEHEASS